MSQTLITADLICKEARARTLVHLADNCHLLTKGDPGHRLKRRTGTRGMERKRLQRRKQASALDVALFPWTATETPGGQGRAAGGRGPRFPGHRARPAECCREDSPRRPELTRFWALIQPKARSASFRNTSKGFEDTAR